MLVAAVHIHEDDGMTRCRVHAVTDLPYYAGNLMRSVPCREGDILPNQGDERMLDGQFECLLLVSKLPVEHEFDQAHV